MCLIFAVFIVLPLLIKAKFILLCLTYFLLQVIISISIYFKLGYFGVGIIWRFCIKSWWLKIGVINFGGFYCTPIVNKGKIYFGVFNFGAFKMDTKYAKIKLPPKYPNLLYMDKPNTMSSLPKKEET